MKNLILLAITLSFLAGCSKASFLTPYGTAGMENGNKIYAYQDIDPSGEHTTIIIARVEGGDPEAKLAKIMMYIKDIFDK